MSTDLVRVEPLLPMEPDAARAAMKQYRELTDAMLTADDWQTINTGKFVKRSGFQKIATGYGISTEILIEDVERDERGQAIRAHAVVRAIHPTGRYQDGSGRCSVDEPRFRTTSGRAKLEHDLPATAVTRATSRAISNLVGFGQVSAEEMDGASPEPAAAGLGDDAIRDVTADLQHVWPNLDAHNFMRVLARRLDGTIPEAAGVALRAWAWWAGKSPESELPVASEPPEEPTEAEEVPTDD